jgi:hypothetical protein
MELKEFSSRQDIINAYNFPRGKQEKVNTKWFMIPLEVQLRNLNHGLGRIIYFQTVFSDQKDNPLTSELEPDLYNSNIQYEMHTDYILLTQYKHKFDCDCGACEEKTRADLIQLDGFDDCYLGVVESYGEHPSVCYDHGKIIERLKKDGMSEEEAEDYFDYNIIGAYFGEKMPVFLINTPLENLRHAE